MAIDVIDVVIGDSYGVGTYCYIRENDCTQGANADHIMEVHLRCNGENSCTVRVLQEKMTCGTSDLSDNDFERITYNCIGGTRS